MPNIKKLSNSVINKIAAGEVIENPASIIKELIENSIDAGASEISINIKNSGLDSIVISDNGKGILRDQLELAFERYSTSKLEFFEDLQQLHSLGFRGEALASIAAISNLTIISKTNLEANGTRLIIKGGVKSQVESYSSINGTIITINNIFFNTPVRRKFLKSPSAELRRITQLVITYALAYPQIGFLYSADNKEKIRCACNQTYEQRLQTLFGLEIFSNLIKIDIQKEYSLQNNEKVLLKLFGFIGKPQIARNTRQEQYFFVNHRPVVDFLCSYKIKETYGTLLDKQSHAVYYLFLAVSLKLRQTPSLNL